MAICDLTEAGKPITVGEIKNLIVTNKEWKAKLKRAIFNDSSIACAISELETLLPRRDV
jgi:type I restriction enzyme S subunit